MKPLSLNKPHLIVMVGIPGAGKSSFAKSFAAFFKAPLISHDRILQEIFDSPERTKKEEIITAGIAEYMLDETLKTGQTVVYDGLSNTRSSRAEIIKKAKNLGYETLLIWVQTDQATARKRLIAESKKRSVINPDQFETYLKKFNPPQKNEKVVVISGKHTYSSQLKIVLKRLADPQNTIIKQPEAPRTGTVRRFLIR
ncbi:MAG: ATP-binding protein [Candidatus Saccharimonadales bacterium]